VNTAARMAGLAKSGQIITTAATEQKRLAYNSKQPTQPSIFQSTYEPQIKIHNLQTTF